MEQKRDSALANLEDLKAELVLTSKDKARAEARADAAEARAAAADRTASASQQVFSPCMTKLESDVASLSLVESMCDFKELWVDVGKRQRQYWQLFSFFLLFFYSFFLFSRLAPGPPMHETECKFRSQFHESESCERVPRPVESTWFSCVSHLEAYDDGQGAIVYY